MMYLGDETNAAWLCTRAQEQHHVGMKDASHNRHFMTKLYTQTHQWNKTLVFTLFTLALLPANWASVSCCRFGTLTATRWPRHTALYTSPNLLIMKMSNAQQQHDRTTYVPWPIKSCWLSNINSLGLISGGPWSSGRACSTGAAYKTTHCYF